VLIFILFSETTEVISQPVYATVQKKPKEKPEQEKFSGETDSKRPAGNFYSHFVSFSCFDRDSLFHLVQM